MNSVTLSTLVDEHLATLASGGYAKSTQRAATRVCRAFLAHAGNIQVRHVTARHVDSYFASRLSQLQPQSLNLELVFLRSLFRFAAARGYMRNVPDPTAHRRRMRVQARGRLRVPSSDFPRLLDATPHPRDRMVVALGIYLLQRQSEIQALRVGHVDLTHGVVSAQIIKTAKFDEMPISSELDTELRRWLTWYAQQVGPLQDSMYLVPAKVRPMFGRDGKPQIDTTLQPFKPIGRPEQVVQRALVACGYSLQDAEGNPMREGVHTLRRSAARAMFDRLCDEGYDRALRIVQSLLHHSSVKQTEGYLGIEADQVHRDDVIRGKEMFPSSSEGNVIPMRRESWQ